MSSILKRLAITHIAAVLLTAMMLGGVKTAQAAIFTSADVLAQSETFAYDPMFQSVGWVGRSSGDSGFGFGGSGVLIDPYWVLTAGHVLTRSDNSGIDAAIFGLSNSIFDDTSHVGAEAWFTFPGFSGTEPEGTNVDLGLIRLADPIFDVAPATRFYGVDEQNTHMYMAGYGAPGVWPDTFEWDGVMRAGENIACFSCSILAQDQYWVARFDRLDPLPFEWRGSPGDSGGGWFTEFDGQMQLAGITSFGGNFNSAAVRTSLYNDWIDDVMASYDTPAVVPEPSTWAMFLIGIVMLGGWHYFRPGTVSA